MVAKINGVFVREKPATMLIKLFQGKANEVKYYPHQLAKECDITYSHAVKLLKIFFEHKIVKFEKKEGRVIPLTLTEKGERIAMALMNIFEMLKNH